jgi:hypothetical protein
LGLLGFDYWRGAVLFVLLVFRFSFFIGFFAVHLIVSWFTGVLSCIVFIPALVAVCLVDGLLGGLGLFGFFP